MKNMCGHKKWKKLQWLKAATVERIVKSEKGNNGEHASSDKNAGD